ncbi:MAG: hypothetical protein AVDCRST_MAG49-1700 [uncultured Thermomicrobiales bacterium]|uniref:Ribonuclease VapC n=1 Tax=uncultured Thermomicrobiales bacterium TaxID=1645740 RepID=A0A6J4UIV9_9BACT|nr:MAG: hypothetical protein AVDCRST_MAG49-1700 [uncultured Thermomicrobiales bacterium]
MTYLFDTDRAADWLNGRADARQLVTRLLPTGIAISAVSYAEIVEGILGGRDPAREEEGFQTFLRAIPVLGIDAAIARRTGELRLDLRRRGLGVNHRALDLFVAATALEHGLTLVTRNTRHYRDVPGLTLYQDA